MPKQAAGDSSEYNLYLTEEFEKRLGKLPKRDRLWVERKLTEYAFPQLRIDPYLGPNIKKLRGYDPDTWRYRIGRYRIFYLVDENEQTVFILTIAMRRDAYR